MDTYFNELSTGILSDIAKIKANTARAFSPVAALADEVNAALGDALDNLGEAQKEITELKERIAELENENAALKAIAAEDNKTFDELEQTEQVAFLQKHFGYNWVKHL